jgi:hypothetical protein
VQEIDRTGDATGYACATHGNFKVADSVFSKAKAKDYTREQWEAALDKAKQRTEPEGWPLIITDDFFWSQPLFKERAKMKLTILFVVVVGAGWLGGYHIKWVRIAVTARATIRSFSADA